MKLNQLCIPLGFFAACQEYNISDNAPRYDQSVPPPVNNPLQEDRIVQVTTPLVDVLWIIDNSCSMDNEQNALAQNFPAFMDYFLGSGLDYHIGTVSTDMDANNQSGKLTKASTGERYITVDTEDPMQIFEEMSKLGTGGSTNERGREAAYAALEEHKDGTNAGFLRDDRTSSVHLIVVSDESDFSRAGIITKPEFIEYLNGLRPEDELVTFNSICNPPGGGLLFPSGIDYIEITNGVGGILHDIREDDWVNVLEQLGMQAAGLKREYFLSQLPVPDTIEVQVHDTEGNVITFEETEYVYSAKRNSITFNTFVPPPLSEVFIHYTVLSAVADVE